MTVCIAALASSGNCIICVADKALSYGDSISWDSDTTKIVPLQSGRGVLMVSGGENASRVVNALSRSSTIGKNLEDTALTAERLYQQCYDEIVEIEVFKQNSITKQEYVSGILGQSINNHLVKIASEVYDFDLGVEIIICGYGSDDGKPYILLLRSPGKVVDVTR